MYLISSALKHEKLIVFVKHWSAIKNPKKHTYRGSQMISKLG